MSVPVIRWIVVAAVVGVTGCASVPAGMEGGPQQTIAVPVSVTPERASAATLQVLTSQGYIVSEAGAGGAVIRTAPRAHNRATTFVIVANVVPAESGARVLLSGSYAIPSLGVANEPMTPGPRLKGELWPRLQMVADSITATAR